MMSETIADRWKRRAIELERNIQVQRSHIAALEADLRAAQAQVAAADALADAISAARVENTDWSEFNALLAARAAYRATRSGTETEGG